MKQNILINLSCSTDLFKNYKNFIIENVIYYKDFLLNIKELVEDIEKNKKEVNETKKRKYDYNENSIPIVFGTQIGSSSNLKQVNNYISNGEINLDNKKEKEIKEEEEESSIFESSFQESFIEKIEKIVEVKNKKKYYNDKILQFILKENEYAYETLNSESINIFGNDLQIEKEKIKNILLTLEDIIKEFEQQKQTLIDNINDDKEEKEQKELNDLKNKMLSKKKIIKIYSFPNFFLHI